MHFLTTVLLTGATTSAAALPCDAPPTYEGSAISVQDFNAIRDHSSSNSQFVFAISSTALDIPSTSCYHAEPGSPDNGRYKGIRSFSHGTCNGLKGLEYSFHRDSADHTTGTLYLRDLERGVSGGFAFPSGAIRYETAAPPDPNLYEHVTGPQDFVVKVAEKAG